MTTYINFSFELIHKYCDKLFLVYDGENKRYIIFGLNIKTLFFNDLKTAKNYFFNMGYDILLNDTNFNTWYNVPKYKDFCKMFYD